MVYVGQKSHHLVVGKPGGNDHDSHEKPLVPIVQRIGGVDSVAALCQNGKYYEDGDSDDSDREAEEESFVGAMAVSVLGSHLPL